VERNVNKDGVKESFEYTWSGFEEIEVKARNGERGMKRVL
jgi:hypothetical protein